MTLALNPKPTPRPDRRKANLRSGKRTTNPKWKVGGWVTFDLEVGQIKEIREPTSVSFTTGFIETSGDLAGRFRPLTLKSKCVVETFKAYYNRLDEIDGSAGFNYPDISQYFAALALEAIDGSSEDPYDKAQAFVRAAHDYTPIIDGIRLFRRR